MRYQKEGEWNWGGYEFRSDDEEVDDKQGGSERVNVDEVNVALQDMPEEESTQLKQRYGIDMTVSSNLAVENLQLHPNTSMGMFKLQFKLPTSGETSIRVFNGAGRLIYDYDLGMFSGDFSDEIDISQNGAGNYYLDIRQGEKRLSKKILLQSK
ncbi:MAG: T9SS type A sorting domain-containing protein [Saprospiraceae bacterium]|nr:T9SS type A sorting domain-containing protein [Saprospiraceae bacterium]